MNTKGRWEDKECKGKGTKEGRKGRKKKKPAIEKMYESGQYLSQMFCLALTATTGSIHDFVTQSSAQF